LQVLLIPLQGTLCTSSGHNHPRNHNNRAQRECAATLTSKLLGSDKDPAWQKITRFALQDDTGTRTDHHCQNASWTLPNLLKMAYRKYPLDADWAIGAAINFVHFYHQYLIRHPEDECLDWTLEKLLIIANELSKNSNQFDGSFAIDAAEKFMECHEFDEQCREEARTQLNTVVMEKNSRTKR
jgi:hypothetical protein